MKTYITAITIILISFLGCSDSSSPTDSQQNDNIDFSDGNTYNSINWVSTDLVFDSTGTKKNLSLLYFRAGWCSWCYKMETETFVDANVIQLLGESFNICKLDTELDTLVAFMDTVLTVNQIKSLYNFTGIPTTVILDSNFNYLGKIYGYRDAETYYSTLNAIRVQYR